ncbi:MAG: ABC transporter ATP-binding protein [Eubacteriales bacterium]|jgi:ATP-binding cassette subfamily B multidrug efflux pump
MPHRTPASFEKPKNLKGTLFRLMERLAPCKHLLALVLLFILLATLCTALGPMVLGQAINQIQLGWEAGQVDFAAVTRTLAVLGGVYLCNSLFMYLQMNLMATVTQRTMYELRKEIDLKLSRLPLRYFDSHQLGDILSRVTNDVDTISNSLQQSLTQLFTSLLTIIFLLAVMLKTSWILTLVGLVTLPLSALATLFISKKAQLYFRSQQKELGNLNGHVEEMFTGHLIVKAFNREKDVLEEFDTINQRLYQCAWKAQFISGVIMPALKTLGNIGYTLVCIVGGLGIVAGRILVGDITTFIQCLRQFNMPLEQLSSIAAIIQSTSAAAERVFSFLDEEEEIPESDHPVQVSQPQGQVTFHHVQFGYSEDRPLIHDLDIQLRSGDKVAIVGPTGAGKTTIVNLLLRFYDVQKGSITIDGVDIREMTRIHLREIFGMVLQDAWLFKGTIRENIRYGRLDATDEQVEQAARAAYCHSFIRTLPGGYDFVLSEDAANISQGERQLLTIARAILADNPIMILDEATSSIDTRTEMLIQKAMSNLMHGRTSFVIAHRLSTIVDADQILVLKDGDIIETGTHQQLLAKGGFYADLYNSQFLGAQDPEAM